MQKNPGDTRRKISQRLKSLDNGNHSIVVYPDLSSFRAIYSDYCKKLAADQDEILVIASCYETVDAVRKTLKNNGIKNVGRYEKDGSLLIVDSVQVYQTDDVEGTLKLAKSLAVRAIKEKKKGVSVIADMGSFFLYEKTRDLMKYELELPKEYDIPLKGFCCYSRGDFGRLTESQQNKLLEHHSEVLAARQTRNRQ